MIPLAAPPSTLPEQAPIVTCGRCRRVLGTVTAALLDTVLGRVMADAMRAGIVRCPDCGPLTRDGAE